MAETMELWEVAAALGIHRTETEAAYVEREIIERSAAYFEETREQRMEHLAGYAERRKRREEERREERRRKVT